MTNNCTAQQGTELRALVIVDVQVDFCEGGALAVDGGAQVAANISALLDRCTGAPSSSAPALAAQGDASACHMASPRTCPAPAAEGNDGASPVYSAIVGTKDWHIAPGGHFTAPGEEPDYQTTWPVHCVADSAGAMPHGNLNTNAIEAWFHKGEYDAAYSGCEGALSTDPSVTLTDWLHARGIAAVDVCGIATDYCVKATALDLHAAGFDVCVLASLTAGVAAESTAAAVEEMTEAGIDIVR